MSLLECLVVVSEKAANIARICRREKHLFELLVEEKGDAESNPRFVQDFKTLADVLIQETVKYEVGNRFPELKKHIKGEENNIFCNKLGEKVCVEIQDNAGETAELLRKVLNGDERAAKVLAEEVHKEVKLKDVTSCKEIESESSTDFDYSKLGIWIDPIDSTAEYISGKEVEGDNGIYISGLRCVTVLLGVFDRDSGIPLIGVVNQPFSLQTEDEWRGMCHWGFTAPSGSKCSCSCSIPRTSSNIVCLSSSEDVDIKNRLSAKGFTLVEAAGAGYKILTVITGLADAYVLSKDTTFKWDTCGPQAILKSLGGDALKFENARMTNSWYSLEYKCNGGEGECENENKIVTCCNVGGIIAYRDEGVCKKIMDALN